MNILLADPSLLPDIETVIILIHILYCIVLLCIVFCVLFYMYCLPCSIVRAIWSYDHKIEIKAYLLSYLLTTTASGGFSLVHLRGRDARV